MIGRCPLHLARETTKSVTAALVGATVPWLAGLGHADAIVVHAMRDVAVGLTLPERADERAHSGDRHAVA